MKCKQCNSEINVGNIETPDGRVIAKRLCESCRLKILRSRIILANKKERETSEESK